MSLTEFRDDLTSPCCRAQLDDDLTRCSVCKKHFPKAEGAPVLIDFEDSIAPTWSSTTLGPGASPIGRSARTGLLAALANFVVGHDPITGQNIKLFLRHLHSLKANPRVLVIGGGTMGSSVGPLYADPSIGIIAFDIYRTGLVQVLADAHRIPLRDHAVDGVLIQAVLEHVLEPEAVVSEIRRVLCPGGIVYAETPFMQQVHEGPYDFTRYTESGHRYLFRDFSEITAGNVGGPSVSLIWSLAYFSRGLFRSRTAGRVARSLFFWLRWFDRLIPATHAIDGACGCYFLGHLQGTPLPKRQIVERYKGAFH